MQKTFNSIEEMKPYYDDKTNTYIFKENDELLDVKFNFDLHVTSNINAGDIKAWDIKAWDIKAGNIKAGDIEYYALCTAYHSFKCCSVKGGRENSVHMCLDSEIEFTEEQEKGEENA